MQNEQKETSPSLEPSNCALHNLLDQAMDPDMSEAQLQELVVQIRTARGHPGTIKRLLLSAEVRSAQTRASAKQAKRDDFAKLMGDLGL